MSLLLSFTDIKFALQPLKYIEYSLINYVDYSGEVQNWNKGIKLLQFSEDEMHYMVIKA